ncbi:hypothetical protein CBR_g53766 [Chara braunii]|uniref:Uncharacterized protein n=1 Tax=Chara braunii TaxID=69332 RepID=A0A388K6Y7_CHABU|nr:hypothetical protein CBR_g53766 [Chara braunii]|eukprot:GBG65796.1 hypothetical protein CBR_g53766 [Chara braunii]
MEGVPPDKFYILGSGAVETIINDGAVLHAVIDNDTEAVIIDEDLGVQVGLGLDRSYLFEIETADGRKQQITGVCHKAAIEVQGVRVTLHVFAVQNCSSELLLGRTWLSHVHAVTIERPDGNQTLSIKKPDGTRVMIETVEPRDPRNRAALAKEKEEVIVFLKEKMVSHVAEQSDSAYANRWFFLRKPNGKIRWIQDLQKVNAVMMRDVGSLPHADLLAEGVADGYRDDRYERSGRDGYRGSRYERGDRDWEQQDGSRGRFERGGDAREQRDESWGWYNRGDRRDESRGRYDSGDRRNDSRGRYEQGGFGGNRRNDPRGRNERGGYGVSSEPYPKSPDPKAARSSISRGTDDSASTPRNSCVYYGGEDHIKRDCPDLKRAIDERLVVLDDRKYVKWADDLGDVSMFPSMKENVEARRIKTSKGMEPVRSQSIKITFEGDIATTPIRVAATKSARGSTSKKTDTDYVMAEKDGQLVDGEEVILSPRKRGVKKFLMKSSLDETDTKTLIPLSEEGQAAPKAEASTIAVTGVTARADRMATVLLDGMEGVSPDKFYILGSGAVETIRNDGAVLHAVIDNDTEAVIIDEDLGVQVGLGLDRSYLFEIETADGRKQQITGVCHKAAIEVQGVRVTLPVFAVKNCSSDLLLGRTWLSHERPDGNQTLSIKKPDGTRVMIETVEPRDPRNRAALAVGARPSDQIKSLPISSRAVRFREKKYGPLLTEEQGRIVEVEDLGSLLIVDGDSYPKEKDEEFGSVVSVSFLRARPPMGGYPSDTNE